MQVQVFPSKREASAAAAEAAAAILRGAIADRVRARIVVSTGNSQLDFIDALVLARDLDWTAVEALHLDEYAGMAATHPASFRLWLKTRLADRVPLRAMHYVNGDAPDLEAECRRYGALLAEAPDRRGFHRNRRKRAHRLQRPAGGRLRRPCCPSRLSAWMMPAAASRSAKAISTASPPSRRMRIVADLFGHRGHDESHLLRSGTSQGQGCAGYHRRPNLHRLSRIDSQNSSARAVVPGP